MKIKKFILSVLIITLFAALASFLGACSQGPDYSGLTKVVFELEGGTYKNSKNAVVHYYDLKEGERVHITAPDVLTGNRTIERSGYTLGGWYTVKDGDGNYSQKWDFEEDTIGTEGVTLYAGWEKLGNHTYGLYYKEGGKDVKLGEYPAKEGDYFRDSKKLFNRRGYTIIRYTDENGNTWNDRFTHPGGATDTEVKVYAEYIEGDYAIVSTAAQLNAASGENIYLLNDIDCKNGKDFTGFSSKTVTGQNGGRTLFAYTHTFLGNGHKISNVTLGYFNARADLMSDDVLGEDFFAVSLFGKLDGAEVKDVTFENVTADLDFGFIGTKKVYVAPLAIYAKDSTVEGVKVSGSFKVSVLPNAFDREEDFISAEDTLTIESLNSNSSITNGTAEFAEDVQQISAAAGINVLNNSTRKKEE